MLKPFNLRLWRLPAAAVVILVCAVAAVGATGAVVRLHQRTPIRIGVLHSMTGTMSISERSLVDAVNLAVEEINAGGGLLDRRVEVVVADGRSRSEVFAAEAERLLTNVRVAAIFGCWTSASRKTVRPVIERNGGVLFYPVQFEGLELSPNMIYTGAAANQQIVPAVRWCVDQIGRRAFLLGSDYVYPRAANAIARDYLVLSGASVVGEEYVPLGARDFRATIDAIRAARPDFIFNTLNGDSNVAFFNALHQAGITSRTIPVMSLSLGEDELRTIDLAKVAGHYASGTYFQSIDTPANRDFVSKFRGRYGNDRVTSDAIATAYASVHLWAQAVRQARAHGAREVLAALRDDQSLQTPAGLMFLDPVTQYAWRPVRIGRIRRDGQFDLVWSSRRPVRPQPFPLSRTVEEWEQLLARWQVTWRGAWDGPA
jgi:urea transport system substrate-binding protein